MSTKAKTTDKQIRAVLNRKARIARMRNAAPDLYEALRDLVAVCPCQNGCAPDDMTCATMKARAALAKAVRP